MSHTKTIRYNGKYSVIEPLDTFSNSFGYVMVVDEKGKVLKFFRTKAKEEAIKYFEYVSLSKWEKIKYWLNHKRGEWIL